MELISSLLRNALDTVEVDKLSAFANALILIDAFAIVQIRGGKLLIFFQPKMTIFGVFNKRRRMTLFTIIAILIILCAAFAFINERFIKLPETIGATLLSVAISIVILVANQMSYNIMTAITSIAQKIDFPNILLNIMLGFLLFATALRFDYAQLRKLRRPMLVMSTISVVISAFVFSGLFYWLTSLLHINVPFIYCLLLGALISPTDSVAVGALLHKTKVSQSLQTLIAGESMFNDGFGLIFFVTVFELTRQSGYGISFSGVFDIFIHEVVDGILIGAAFGILCSRLIKFSSTHQTMFLISIATVLSISLVAQKLHASIPLAAVVAGLIVGNGHLKKQETGNRFLTEIWQLLDEVLNIILFVLMGLQLVLMPFLKNYWLIGLLSIIVILIGRFLSVFLPTHIVLHRKRANLGNLFILTWAGLRGGISVAMALSLPDSPYREIILSCCYFMVLFSIIVQGLTLSKVADAITSRRRRGFIQRK